ncbi:MAG: SMI1/KNR4 family protein [Planctomycetota bacterium]|nr:SMI1/KNR4 family protein [Planctomycetota bacterium]
MPFPVDPRWIQETEQKLGVRFPASFVISMMRRNGGTVATPVDHFELFPFLDASDRKRLARTCSSIDRETNQARRNTYGFPADAVAIGANGGGDLLVLLPMSHDPTTLQCTVFWWDHETGKVAAVADDFDELRRM